MRRSYFTIHDQDSGDLIAVGVEEDFRDIFANLDEPKHLPARWLVRWHDAALQAGASTPDGAPQQKDLGPPAAGVKDKPVVREEG